MSSLQITLPPTKISFFLLTRVSTGDHDVLDVFESPGAPASGITAVELAI